MSEQKRKTGTVRFFISSVNQGVIKPDDGTADLDFYIPRNSKTLKTNDNVEYDVVDVDGTNFAENITAPGGEPLPDKFIAGGEARYAYCYKCQKVTCCLVINGDCVICGGDGEGSDSGGGEKKSGESSGSGGGEKKSGESSGSGGGSSASNASNHNFDLN